MQNIAIAKEDDEHQERCLFFFRINRFELLNKGHVPWAGFLGWSMAHPDHPLATPLSRDAGLPPPDIRACRRRASRAIVCIREPGTSAAACGLAIICIWVIAASISILQEVVLQF